MSDPNTQPVFTELKLTSTVKPIVDRAFDRGRFFTLAYVNPAGKPELSFRGSVQVFSDTQLAIWARNPEGGFNKAIASNPHVTLLYGDFAKESYSIITFRGRARIDASEAVRRKVYESAHEQEQARDKDRKGDAIIIDLDSVDGIFPGGVLKMRAAGAG